MPSAFDQFGPFENSLRSYSEKSSRCPLGLHVGECPCEAHECKRPHCSNDVPLDPCCKLANGTPYGVPITSWPTNRCHETIPLPPSKPLSMFSSMVTARLYSTSTLASAAKKRSGSSRPEDQYDSDEFGSSRCIKEIGRNESGSIRSRSGDSPKVTRKNNNNFVRESSRSPDRSPVSSPYLTVPNAHKRHVSPIRKRHCSPKPEKRAQSPNSLKRTMSPVPNHKSSNVPERFAAGATPRPAVARFSAAFAGGSLKLKSHPLNKSASDGIERMRKSFKNPPKFTNKVNKTKTKKCDTSPPVLFQGSMFLRKSSTRKDELLLQAKMVLRTLALEIDEAFKTNRRLSTNLLNQSQLYDVHEVRLKDLSSVLNKARTEEQLELTRSWMQNERLWLVHKGGFCASYRVKVDSPSEDDKIKIKLEHNEDVIEVDEDDVEKTNPATLDRCEDLSQLQYLNESSMLHTIRQRYGSNLIHTYAGSSLIVINPTVPLAIYSEKVIQMFKGCLPADMPPHIYSVAQGAYRDLLTSRKDQSVLFIGRSGAGKTTNFRHVLHYLALNAGCDNSLLTVERLNAISTLLEAFGNGRTLLNTNATRFTQIFSLDFDNAGRIVSASVQAYMPEKMRVVRRPEGEPNYHIFYQLLAGADEDLRSYLSLGDLSEPNLFMTPLQRAEDKQRAGIAWARIRAALDILSVSEEEQKAIWSVLAAIYHLGISGVTKAASTNKYQFEKPAYAVKCSNLLGTSVEELSRAIFSIGPNRLKPSSPTERSSEKMDGLEALEGMACGLYNETFNAIVALINRCISTSAHATNSILVVDSPGAQNPGSCGRSNGASFADLCHNYTQERLQLLYHDATFTTQADRYAQENIDYSDVTGDLGTPAPLISLLDKSTSNSFVRSSHADFKEADRRGILWMLDEEAIYPGASDLTFIERVFSNYGDREHSNLIKRGPSSSSLSLLHFQGTNSVTYDVNGWLKASRENQVMRQATAVLQESNRENISRLYVFCRGPVSNTISGSVVGIEGSQSLRRASSIRRAFTTGTAAIKRKSVCLQVKFTVDGIVETLRRTKLRFVHCLLPQHNAGLSDLKVNSKNSVDASLINVPLLRSQIRGAQLLDSLRIYKQGFPEHLQYSEFWRKFSVLCPDKHSSPDRSAVQAILDHIDLDSSSYRIGLTQVFFRTGTISSLEEQRDLVLSDAIKRFQARCRGALARRRLKQRKVQETAIKCIQKNVRKFIGVRDWPWWRLLVRVTPLLDVHRTEEELKIAKEQLESIKIKFDKSEKERSFLKQENDRMESKLAEITADLQDQHSTSHLASERLEAEQSERMRLEKDISQLQDHINLMTTANDKLEQERITFLNHEINGDTDDSDIYKRKYEWSLKEIEVLRHKFRQHEENSEDKILLLKKQMEKKILDAHEEADEQRQIVGQSKKKCQRIQAELNDIKILLEQQTARNNLLEKKQRKFDQDISCVNDAVRNERLSKEKTQRDKDLILAQKYSLEQELSTMKLENELKDEKIKCLKSQIDDLSGSGKDEDEVVHLKKIKHELEYKVKDQEEELDDLAGQVQMLESAKTRLEMSIEQMRKENRSECQVREDELEEIRASAQKKIKNLESQLESDYEERAQLVKEKHELERRLADAQERTTTVDEDYVHRLKKELKRTKALLKDTTTMLEKNQSDGSNKAVVRQLRSQLEDAEFAKTMAVKSRQGLEADLADVQIQFDEALRNKKDAEDKCIRVTKEKADLQMQIDENDEENMELMKKYKSTVSQLSIDQITMAEQTEQISDLEIEKQSLQEKLSEMTSKVEVLEGETASIHTQRRLQMKIKELESKLELEHTTKQRLEGQVGRLKDQMERMNNEMDGIRQKEFKYSDESKKLSRLLREARDELNGVQQKNTEVVNRKLELEKQLELSDGEIATLKADLKLAFKRIEDLQQALHADLSETDEDIGLDSESDSESSLSSYLTASLKCPRTSSNSTLRTPSSELLNDSNHDIARTESGRSMTAISEDLEEDDVRVKESYA